MIDRPSRVVGLLLLYYQPYADASIRQFISILNAVSSDNLLIIVDNNGLVLPPITHPNIHRVSGDNFLREFSGWQAGLHYCQQHRLLPSNGILVLANDTFCHHNKFGPITRMAFVKAFKRLLKNADGLAMAGEIQSSTSPYSIADKPFSEWVSTYLYAVTAPLIEKVEQLVPPIDLDLFFTHQAEPDKFLKGPLNPNLKRHITAWLFGLGSSARWYGSKPLSTSNMQQFIGKSKSILCEMYLSAAVTGLGADLVSVFNSRFLRQARKLERLLPQYRKSGPGRSKTELEHL